MKRTLLLLFVLLLGLTAIFAGEPVTGIGAGLTLGIPFGVHAAGEYNFGPAYAGLEIGYQGEFGVDYFSIRAEGGYNFPKPFVNKDWGMDLYLSVGGKAGIYLGKDDYTNKLAVAGTLSIPVTWTWYADNLPLKVFVKAGPEIYFTKVMNPLLFSGSAGAMYVFSLKPKQSNVGNQQSVGAGGVPVAPVGVSEIRGEPEPVAAADVHQQQPLAEPKPEIIQVQEPAVGGENDLPIPIGENEADAAAE